MEISLPCGRVALIDDADAHLATLKWWFVDRYVRRSRTKANTCHLLHRAVTQAPSGTVVDHINGDTLDNRRANLRVVTHRANSHNTTSTRKNGSHGAIGVTWNKRQWQAQIRVDGRLKHIGVFKTFDEAREARRVAEIELWGVEPRRESELMGNR